MFLTRSPCLACCENLPQAAAHGRIPVRWLISPTAKAWLSPKQPWNLVLVTSGYAAQYRFPVPQVPWPFISCYEKWRKSCCKKKRQVNTLLDLESHPQNQKWKKWNFWHILYIVPVWHDDFPLQFTGLNYVSLQLTRSVTGWSYKCNAAMNLKHRVYSHSVPCCRAFARNLHSWNIRNSIRCPQGVQLPSAATHPWHLAVTVVQNLFIELVVSFDFNHDLTKEITNNDTQNTSLIPSSLCCNIQIITYSYNYIYTWTSKHVRNLHYQLGFQAFLRSSG